MMPLDELPASPSPTPPAATGLPFQTTTPAPNANGSDEPKKTSDPEKPLEAEPVLTTPKQGTSGLLAATIIICAALLGATAWNLILKDKFPNSTNQSQLDQDRENIAILSQTNRERAAAGQSILSPNSQAETLDSISQRISRDSDAVSKVAKNLLETSQRKDSQIATKQRAFEDLDRQYQFLSRELTELKMKYQQNSLAANQLSAVQAQLNQKIEQISMLTKELMDAKTKLTQAQPDSAVLEIRRQLEEVTQAKKFFEDRCKELEGKLQTPTPAATQLFAKSEQDLEPVARQLYKNLVSFEGASPESLVKTYESLNSKFGASHTKTVSFNAGSSKIEAAQMADLQNLIGSLPNRGMILVVGYASTTGDATSNRTLSSARATAVAAALQQYKAPDQHVQAVYLGQTNRFGKEAERNQICEIWQILAPGEK